MTPVPEIYSQSINDTSEVIRMTILSNATTWSVTHDHLDNSRGVIYDCNISMIQATGSVVLVVSTLRVLGSIS